MIIDIHSHILPKVDDGAKDMRETERMLSRAVRQGIRAIIATPHYDAGAGKEKYIKCRNSYEKVRKHIEECELPIKLYLGNEIFYSESIIDELQQGYIHTMNETRYVLVEFPLYVDYDYIERALRNIQNAGYWPILAHAERYESLRNIEKIRTLVEMGIYIQINQGSLINKKRFLVRSFCLKLMKAGLVHLLATDCHDSKQRRPEFKECFEYLDKKIGKSYRVLISEENPEKIIEGEKIRE